MGSFFITEIFTVRVFFTPQKKTASAVGVS